MGGGRSPISPPPLGYASGVVPSLWPAQLHSYTKGFKCGLLRASWLGGRALAGLAGSLGGKVDEIGGQALPEWISGALGTTAGRDAWTKKSGQCHRFCLQIDCVCLR